ncbi:peptide deformylase [Candidatus Kaiserbacteria bacterium]|nr:peptide deformylase [Candidatus Kaiserbacteria bacterium]
MAKLVEQSHEALHRIADEVPVEEIPSPKIQKVLKDMESALKSYNAQGFVGVAIAAPQIGIPLRIFLVKDMSTDRSDEEKIPTLVAINPKIIKTSKKKSIVGEGCLSVPDHYGAVERAHQATIRAYDENGNEYERGGSGLLAQIFQHECDHLDGTLFVDRAEKVWSKDEMEKHNLREAHE